MTDCMYLFPFLEKLHLAFILFHQESLVTLLSGQELHFYNLLEMPLSTFYILSSPSWLTCLVLLLEDGTLKVENGKSQIAVFCILMTHFIASGRFLLVHVPPQMSSFILVFKEFRPWFLQCLAYILRAGILIEFLNPEE